MRELINKLYKGSSTAAKMVWNSPIDSEETLETKMAELIKESIYHCVSEANSNGRLASYPPSSQALTPSYATRFAAWEKSMRELSDDANAAMGTLMALFDPDCNVHRELTAWFEWTCLLSCLNDYNFRNAWSKFYARYQPNKQVNLDTISKKWENLTDGDHTFADFHGKYIKLIEETELIGQPPTIAKQFEMLRRNVKNPNLSHIVVNLSLPDSRKISLEGFFEDCNHFIQYNKEKDSGRKRKAEEVLGRTVKVSDDSSADMPLNAVCYRCGRPGHTSFYLYFCQTCSLRYSWRGCEGSSLRGGRGYGDQVCQGWR